MGRVKPATASSCDMRTCTHLNLAYLTSNVPYVKAVRVNYLRQAYNTACRDKGHDNSSTILTPVAATEKPRGANFFRIHRGSKSETILRSAVEHLPSDQNFLTGDDPPTWGAVAATPTQTPKPDVLMGFNFHLRLTRTTPQRTTPQRTTPQRTGNERVKRTNRHFRKLYLSLKKSNSYLRVTIGLKAVPF